MTTILIKNGTVIDPARKISKKLDVFIQNGKITDVAPDITKHSDHLIDASRKIVTPGFVDLHAHLREPGYEAAEA